MSKVKARPHRGPALAARTVSQPKPKGSDILNVVPFPT